VGRTLHGGPRPIETGVTTLPDHTGYASPLAAMTRWAHYSNGERSGTEDFAHLADTNGPSLPGSTERAQLGAGAA